MKKRLLQYGIGISFCYFLTLGFAFPGELRAGSLSLDSCIYYAQIHYPQIRRFEYLAYAEAFNLKNASLADVPQFNLTGKVTYQSDVVKFPFDLPPVFGISMPEFNKLQYNVAVELSQNVWNGGQTKAEKSQIKAASEIERQKVVAEFYQLRRQVQQLFFGVLLLNRQLEQNTIFAQSLATSLDQVKAYQISGMANQSDLDVVLVEQLNSRQARTELVAARRAYIQMLGLIIGQELADDVEFEMPELVIPADRTIKRPELDQYEAMKNQIRAQRDSHLSRVLPRIQVFVQGAYGYPGLNYFSESAKPYVWGGLRMQWNLAGIYTNPLDKRRLKVNEQEVQTMVETFELQTRVQSAKERSDILKAQELMLLDDSIIALRTRIRQSTAVKLKSGTSSVTDLIRDQHSEQMAHQQKALHEMHYVMSIYDLKHTLNQ